MISTLQRVAVVLVLLFVAGSAHALPRFSLISGTRCSACHYSPNGGGLRTELGWDALNKGAWRWPWEKPEPGEGGGDDLFGAPGESGDETGAMPGESGELSEDPGAMTAGDDGGAAAAFETAEPLPAHETTATDETGEPAETAAATDETPGDMPGDEPAAAVHTNSLFDGLITPGADLRLQVTKIGRPPNDKRMLLPMQAQLNVAVTPLEWLVLYGGYNYAVTQRSYPGQSEWEATLQLHPGVTLPILRLGFMQPSIGIRHDDHTTFTRREVAGQSPHPLVPPGYADLGAELTYEGLNWLTINAGVFGSHMLSEVETSIGEIESVADFSKPSVLGRVMLWPQELDLGFNGELGASYFGNGDFRMINAFGGFGMADKGSIFVEALIAEYPSGVLDSSGAMVARNVRNVSILGSYQLFTWLSLDWRYEFGQTEVATDNPAERTLAHAHQAVFGLEFFPLPYVEIRPEYRFFQNESFNKLDGYQQGQYTLQLHLFY